MRWVRFENGPVAGKVQFDSEPLGPGATFSISEWAGQPAVTYVWVRTDIVDGEPEEIYRVPDE